MDNLLSNACKFSPAGSVVQIYSWQEEGVVSIAVKDEGSGIPDSFKPFVFEKFRQGDASTSRNYPGTGLGLSISEHLVEQFDGTLTFESEIGVGTTFIVSLPVYEEYLLREIEAVPDQAVRDINGRCTPG
jgi:signal transduction histidine kinase